MANKRILKRYLLGVLCGLILCGSVITAQAVWYDTEEDEDNNVNVEVNSLYNESSRKQLNPKVLNLALRAYQQARHQGLAKKDILTIIDYSLPSTQRRLWVVDLKNNRIPFYTLVAHGQTSGGNNTTHFSDAPGSKASSLGVFLTGDTYVGGRGYSLNLYGLEKGFNSRAYQRRVVIHGAWYVNERLVKRFGRIGRSWGCPAVDQKIAPQMINYIKKGSVVFAYYPDRNWLNRSRFLNGSRAA